MSNTKTPVIVDQSTCTGCGLCVNVYAPEVFELNDDGLAEAKILEAAAYEEHKDEIEEAIENCPVEAIHWADEDEDEE